MKLHPSTIFECRLHADNGVFIDKARRASERGHPDHPYSVWVPGLDPSGCAGRIGTAHTLKEAAAIADGYGPTEDEAVAAVDLNLCTNLFGPLDGEVRARLKAVLDGPTNDTWEEAYSVVLNGERMEGLWQAVCDVDPSFPRSQSTEDEPWVRVPTRRTIALAITRAVVRTSA